jgi:hypothetical protein
MYDLSKVTNTWARRILIVAIVGTIIPLMILIATLQGIWETIKAAVPIMRDEIDYGHKWCRKFYDSMKNEW